MVASLEQIAKWREALAKHIDEVKDAQSDWLTVPLPLPCFLSTPHVYFSQASMPIICSQSSQHCRSN